MTRSLVLLLVILLSQTGCSDSSENETSQAPAPVTSPNKSSGPARKTLSRPAEPAMRNLAIEVKMVETGETAVAAELYAVPAGMVSDSDYFERTRKPEKWGDRLERAVARATTGADGKGTLEIPNRGAYQIIAVKGGLVADARIQPQVTSRLQLTLEEDTPLRVRVVDSLGQPLAGVAVGISRTKSDRQVRGVRLSDEGGWVSFEHPKRWLQPTSRSDFDNVIVGVAEVFNPPVRQLVRGFGESKELTLPPHGSVAVRAPAAESDSIVYLGIKLEGDPQPEQLVRAHRNAITSWRVKQAGAEEVVFPYVGLDLPLYVQEEKGPAVFGDVGILRGPGLAGDQIEADIPPSAPGSVIHFRLVDERMKPIANRLCELRVGDQDGRVTRNIARTDAEGRMKAPFHFAGAAHSGKVEPPHIPPGLHFALRTSEGRNARSRRVTGAWNKGEFIAVIERDHLIVSGTVKSGQGQPIEHALIRLEKKQGNGYLELKTMAPILTDQNGRFQIRARSIDGLIRVRAERFDHETAYSSNVVMGGEALEIRMERKSRVTGRVLIDSVLQPRTLNILFRASGQQKEIPYPLQPDGKGRLKLDAAFVMPGIYDVVIVENDTVGRLHKIDGIRVPFRGDQEPKELNPVDLTGKLRDLELTVLDKNQQPVPTALVELSSPEGAALSYRQVKGTNERGQVFFRAPLGPLNANIRIEPENSYTVTIDSKVAKQTIQPRD